MRTRHAPRLRRRTGHAKSRLDLLLDRVKPREHEVTIDTEGYTRADVDRIIATARGRGLHAAFDGRFVLVRDMRNVTGHARFIGPRPMTLADAKEQLRPIGVVLAKRDGEYRVNRKGAAERSAYYTDDLWDAVATGQTMR